LSNFPSNIENGSDLFAPVGVEILELRREK
jgi:hypothetical protein